MANIVFPQFGGPDYGGFTTEEEIARRSITTDARNSPLIGARMYMPPVPQESISPREEDKGAQQTREVKQSKQMSVSEAVAQLLKSKPTTALDWFIIFVIIVAIVCFLGHWQEILGMQSHTPQARPIQQPTVVATP